MVRVTEAIFSGQIHTTFDPVKNNLQQSLARGGRIDEIDEQKGTPFLSLLDDNGPGGI